MKKLIIILFISLFLSSCITEPIDNYKGGIVYSMTHECNKTIDDEYIVKIKIFNKIKNQFKFRNVHVEKFDFDKYNIGDTIK